MIVQDNGLQKKKEKPNIQSELAKRILQLVPQEYVDENSVAAQHLKLQILFQTARLKL